MQLNRFLPIRSDDIVIQLILLQIDVPEIWGFF